MAALAIKHLVLPFIAAIISTLSFAFVLQRCPVFPSFSQLILLKRFAFLLAMRPPDFCLHWAAHLLRLVVTATNLPFICTILVLSFIIPLTIILLYVFIQRHHLRILKAQLVKSNNALASYAHRADQRIQLVSLVLADGAARQTSLETDSNALRQDLQAARSQNNDLKAKLKSVNAELESLKYRLNSAHDRLADAATDRDFLRIERDNLEVQLNAEVARANANASDAKQALLACDLLDKKNKWLTERWTKLKSERSDLRFLQRNLCSILETFGTDDFTAVISQHTEQKYELELLRQKVLQIDSCKTMLATKVAEIARMQLEVPDHELFMIMI